MTNFEVVNESGVDINGSHYDQGHIFSFEGIVPDHIAPFIEAGDLAETDKTVDVAEGSEVADRNTTEKATEGEGEPLPEAPAEEPTLKKYKVLAEAGIDMIGDEGEKHVAEGEEVELDPEAEGTKEWLETMAIEEVEAE